MKPLQLTFCSAILLLACKYLSSSTKPLTIDPSIKEKVIQNVTNYTDSFQLTNDSISLSNKYMVELYTNDTLSISTYKAPKTRTFKSNYFWNKDTLNIYGVFNFGMIGFTISIYNDTAIVYGVINNNTGYKIHPNDSILSHLLIPTIESHVVLSKMPEKKINEKVYGYVELKQSNIFLTLKENPNFKERLNMKAYFISDKIKN